MLTSWAAASRPPRPAPRSKRERTRLARRSMRRDFMIALAAGERFTIATSCFLGSTRQAGMFGVRDKGGRFGRGTRHHGRHNLTCVLRKEKRRSRFGLGWIGKVLRSHFLP